MKSLYEEGEPRLSFVSCGCFAMFRGNLFVSVLQKKERFPLCKIGKNRYSFDTKLEQENIYF